LYVSIVIDIKRGSVLSRCTLDSAVLHKFSMQNGST
jgi:hypothetical protein